MAYTLWSNGRLVGHTDLDLPHVQHRVRMGFVEPAADAEAVWADATGVGDAILAFRRATRSCGEDAPAARTAEANVQIAIDRREAVAIELRDASGRAIDVEWIQVTDLRAEWMSDEALELDLADDADEDVLIFDDASGAADLEADAATLFGGEASANDVGRMDREAMLDDLTPQPWTPPDERWDTMRYYMMVLLHAPTDLP